MDEYQIANPSDLRELYGSPNPLAENKVLSRLDDHCRRFISFSPFAVLATTSSSGAVDASPRGDAPGFVTCADDMTLLMPDRPGNNRTDSFSNLLQNAGVGLLFFIPGVNETLRVNGRASISIEPDLLKQFVVRERLPKSVIRIDIDEVFLHCAKALIRSRLWEDNYRIERKTLPSLGKMLSDQIEGADPVQSEEAVRKSQTENLY